jgi:hypothetical protein
VLASVPGEQAEVDKWQLAMTSMRVCPGTASCMLRYCFGSDLLSHKSQHRNPHPPRYSTVLYTCSPWHQTSHNNNSAQPSQSHNQSLNKDRPVCQADLAATSSKRPQHRPENKVREQHHGARCVSETLSPQLNSMGGGGAGGWCSPTQSLEKLALTNPGAVHGVLYKNPNRSYKVSAAS